MDPERWRQIESLYHAAAEQAPEQRAAFLESACPDLSLRREIESLIEDPANSGILGRSVAFSAIRGGDGGKEDSDTRDFSDAVLPGQTIYQYRVSEKIGRGGMGEVFLAEDTILKRRVALKFLTTNEGETAGRGILAEARSAAAIDHPAVCKIFATGEFEGKPFIVMEFVEGETLRERLKAGPIPFHAALPILIEISEALAEAHGKGMIHCDIKPGNVMTTRGGHVKLMDFGLARRVPRTLGPDDATSVLTPYALGAGTPAYMAPEQARGERLDARADVFALGILFFEMLTGIHPFRGTTTVATMGAILYADAPAIGKYIAAAPPLLAQIFTRALAKDLAERYASARELASDLIALRDQRHTQNIAPVLPTIAILPFHDLSPEHDQDYFCDGLAEELIVALGRVEQLRVVSRSAAFQFRNAAIGLSEIGKALQATMILEGSVRKAGDRLRVTINLVDIENGRPVWSERYDRRLDDIFEVQDDISRSVSGKMQLTFNSGAGNSGGGNSGAGQKLTEAGTHLVPAYESYLKGRYYWNKRTEESLRLSLKHFEEAIAGDPQYAKAWAGLADAWVTLCIYGAVRPAEAMPLARHAVDRALELRPQLPEAILSRACIRAVFEWDWRGAERDFEKAIKLNPKSAQARQWFAMHCLAPCRRFERAERELRLAAELEPESPAIATSLGVLDFFRGKLDAAIRRFRAVLELNQGFYLAHYFLGQAFSEKQMHDEALQELEHAVSLANGSVESLSALGYEQAAAGHEAESLQILHQLQEREADSYVSPVAIAQVQVGLDQIDPAMDNLENALRCRAIDLIWLGVRPAFAKVREQERVARIMIASGLRKSILSAARP